jgi:hypothetical protein
MNSGARREALTGATLGDRGATTLACYYGKQPVKFSKTLEFAVAKLQHWLGAWPFKSGQAA